MLSQALGLVLLLSLASAEQLRYHKSSYIIFEKNNGNTEKIHRIKLQQYDEDYCEDNYYEKLCKDGSDHDGLYITYGALIQSSTTLNGLGDPTGTARIYTVVDHDQGVGNRFRFMTSPEPVIISTPEGVTMTVTNALDCPNDVSQEGSPCDQQWDVTIDPIVAGEENGMCDLDGEYTFELTVECYAGILDCPPEVDGLADIFTFHIDSQDLCSDTVATAEVEGNLRAFEDSERLKEQEAYLAGVTIYFDSDVRSDVVTAVGLSILDISVQHRGQVFSLLTNSLMSADGLALNLAFDNAEGTFQFDLDPVYFPIEFRKMENVDVAAVIQIQYNAAHGPLLSKSEEMTMTLNEFTTISISNGEVDTNDLHESAPKTGSAAKFSVGLWTLILMSVVVCVFGEL